MPPTASSPEPSNTSFLIAALACGIPAGTGVFWFFSPQGQEAHPAVRVAVLAAATAGYLAAAWLYTWANRNNALARPLLELPTALLEVKGQLADLNAIKKEYNRYQAQMEGLVGQITKVLQGMNDELARRLADLDARQKAFDQLVTDRRETERKISEIRQEVTRAAADVKKWEQSVVEFAQLLERTSDPASGLSPEYQRAATKMTSYFAKAFGPFGLQLVSPAEGDQFDTRVHQVEGSETHPTVLAGQVVRCIEWGFILRDEVRKAKVILASRPVAPTKPPPPASAQTMGSASSEPTSGSELIPVDPPVPTNQRQQNPTRRKPA